MVTIRQATDADRPAVGRMFDGLSTTSRYLRFHGLRAAFRDDEIAALCADDGGPRIAWVAMADGPRPTCLGVAQAIALPGDGAAVEVAITVADRHQRRGIGTTLLRCVSQIAFHRGYARARLEMLSSHPAIAGVLRHLRAAAVRWTHATVTIDLGLPLAPGSGG